MLKNIFLVCLVLVGFISGCKKSSSGPNDYFLAKYLKNLPSEYTYKMALINNDVIINNDGSADNLDKLEKFMKYKGKKPKLIRIVDYEYESENKPVITLLIFNLNKIYSYSDENRIRGEEKPFIKSVWHRIDKTSESEIDPDDEYKLITTTSYYFVDKNNKQGPQIVSKEQLTDREPVEKIVKVEKRFLKADLDGDKKAELISLNYVHRTIDSTALDPSLGSISINDLTEKIDNANFESEPEVKIIDINRKDKIKELVLSSKGSECSSSFTSIYCYDGKQIIHIDSFDSSFDDMTVRGNGIIRVISSSKLLPAMWSIEQFYKLTESHFLEKIPTGFYKITYQPDTTAGIDLPLQKSPTNNKIVATLKKGEKIKVIGTDDKFWCLAANSKGARGWFGLKGEDMDATVTGTGKTVMEVFSGIENYLH